MNNMSCLSKSVLYMYKFCKSDQIEQNDIQLIFLRSFLRYVDGNLYQKSMRFIKNLYDYQNEDNKSMNYMPCLSKSVSYMYIFC